MANLRPQAPEPEPQLTPVRDVFSALAEELERARSLGLRVEGAICAIAVRSSIDGSVVSELQQLDAVLQHIAALRDFASELARQSVGVGEVATASALERVTLGEVRVRLGGRYLDGDDPDDNWEML
ncbi:MAG: hypothetical protein ABL864_06055 [Terricaulis sp.]|jgi:hypothetical protein